MFNREMLSDPCIMHWIVLLFALIGVFLTFWFRRNREALLIIDISDIVLMLVFAILGECMTEFLWAGVATLTMGIENFFWSREKD